MARWSPLDGIPEPIIARAARVQLVCFDVDGVMTDGGLYYSDLGHEAKRFDVQDGLGLKMLLAADMHVAVITARDSAAVRHRMRDLGILHTFTGIADKRAQLVTLASELGVAIENAAHVGDDLPDLGPMRTVGFAIAVANAHPIVAETAHWRTNRAGGAGAVREVCELLLAARGRYDAILERFSA